MDTGSLIHNYGSVGICVITGSVMTIAGINEVTNGPLTLNGIWGYVLNTYFPGQFSNTIAGILDITMGLGFLALAYKINENKYRIKW